MAPARPAGGCCRRWPVLPGVAPLACRRPSHPRLVRCAGCDHFRTDVSYLPDLHAYLDDLLRTRERLLAATDLDDWARAEAMPSHEEMRRIRRLIDQISHRIDELKPEQRQQLQQAVS